MITNFIFDMGNVLLDFSPDFIISTQVNNPEDVETLKHSIFTGQAWKDFDNGDTTIEAIIEEKLKLVPETLHDAMRSVLLQWDRYMLEKEDMTELVKELKEKGYGIYLCSNAASTFHDFKHNYKVFDYFDHCTISADIRISKPEAGIYEHVLKTNNLDPSTCLFVDDLMANIVGAKKCGIAGYNFNGNVQLFRKYLTNTGIL